MPWARNFIFSECGLKNCLGSLSLAVLRHVFMFDELPLLKKYDITFWGPALVRAGHDIFYWRGHGTLFDMKPFSFFSVSWYILSSELTPAWEKVKIGSNNQIKASTSLKGNPTAAHRTVLECPRSENRDEANSRNPRNLENEPWKYFEKKNRYNRDCMLVKK